MKVIILCQGHFKGQSFMSTKKKRKNDLKANVKKNLRHTIICEKKQPTHKGWIGWVIPGGRSFILEIIQQHIRPGWSSEETHRFSYDNMLAGKVKVSGLHTIKQFWVCIGENKYLSLLDLGALIGVYQVFFRMAIIDMFENWLRLVWVSTLKQVRHSWSQKLLRTFHSQYILFQTERIF